MKILYTLSAFLISIQISYAQKNNPIISIDGGISNSLKDKSNIGKGTNLQVKQSNWDIKSTGK